MAQQETREVTVRLPGDRQTRVRVPADWGPDQIRQAMADRGLLETPASGGRKTPAQALSEEGVGGFLKATGQQIVERDIPAVTGAVARAAQSFGPEGLKATPGNLMEAAKAGLNQFIYEKNEFERLLMDAWRGHAADKPENRFSLPGRIGRVGLAALHALGAPFMAVAKAYGHNVQKTAAHISGSEKVGEVLGQAAEAGILVFSGAGASAVRREVVEQAAGPIVSQLLLDPNKSRAAAVTMAELAINEAKVKGVSKRAVFKTLEQMQSRMDPALQRGLMAWDARLAGLTGKAAIKRAGLHETVLDSGAVRRITEGATAALVDNFDKSKRIFQNIFEEIGQRGFVPQELKPIMQKWGMTPEQLASEYAHTVSTAGKLLNYHSRVAKALNAAFESDPGAKRVLAAMQKTHPDLFEPTIGDYVNRAIGGALNFWRSLLTTQLVTAMRNYAVGISTYTAELFGNVLYDTVGGVATMAKGQYRKGLEQMFTSINAAVKTGLALKPLGARKELLRVLDDPQVQDGLYKMRLISQPMGDLHLSNKVSYIANSFNRWQEYFVRGAAAEFRLRAGLARRGMRLETTPVSQIPEDLLEDMVDFSRRITFSWRPRFGTPLHDFIDGWEKLKVVTYPINPFPNFSFANAIPFFAHKASGGITHLLSRDAQSAITKLIAKKKPLTAAEESRMARIMGDASSGALLWWSAWNMRQKAHELRPDSLWNEIPTDDNNFVDTRPLWPYSMFLFMSEFMQRPERIKWQDWVENWLAVPHVGGTSLMIADLIRAKDAWSGYNVLTKIAGKIMSGFSTPLRQFRDIIEFDMNPEDAILRDTRQDPLLGPFLNNVPFFNAQLPKKYSPLRAGELELRKPEHEFEFMGRKYKMSSLTLRQLTGISENVKTEIQKKVDELQLDPAAIFPRTGNAEADNLVAKAQGYFIARVAEPLIPKLDTLPEPMQRLVLRRLFTASKAYGRALLAATHPRLWNEIKALKADEDQMQVIQEFGGINPFLAVDQELAARGFSAPNVQRGINK